MKYTIGEIANKLNLNPSTLRYYDSLGLLNEIKRDKNGNRVFDDNDVYQLKFIECLKKSNLSIKNIKLFLDYAKQGDKTIDKRYQIIVDQKEIVKNKIQELNNTLEFLEYKEWYYKVAKEHNSTDIHNRLDISKIPKEFLKYINK